MSIEVHYDSNNSGGNWWLSDQDWKNLEKAGWYVIWGGLIFCGPKQSMLSHHRNRNWENICAEGVECPGHRMYESADEAKDNRWLGALAREARKTFPTLRAGVEEWESVTGQSATEEGCNCCGRPHLFDGITDDGKGVWFSSYPSRYERSYGDE